MTQRQIGLFTSLGIIVTNMVGTGVFTSLGFQLASLSSPFAILVLWGLGGLAALCGAAVYAELALAFPGSGGEYHFLARIYHPAAGFLAGWLSATVGFAAPIALSAMAFGQYAARVLPWVHPGAAACLCIAAMALVHARGLRTGAAVQGLLTLLALILVVLIIGAGLRHVPPQPLDWRPSSQVFSAPFAVSLVWVSYAFSGWNAATYVAGEIRRPRVHLPASLLLGSTLVTLLYLGLNLAFLRCAPAQEMRGALEVAHIAARHLFGPQGARLMSAVLCLVLLGSVSGMLFAGSRIPAAMAEAGQALPFLGRRNGQGAPVGSVLAQSALALVLVLSGSFEGVLALVGFTLGLSTCLCVAGLFVVRRRQPAPSTAYRCWGYPLSPLLFLALNLWMLAFTFLQKPLASSLGLAAVASGIPVYLRLQRRRSLGLAVGEAA